MSVEVLGMVITGIVVLVAGLVLVRTRCRVASGVERVLLLGPIFYATALAIFAAEHYLAARDLMGIVPKWLPEPLFWTYFVGTAWLAAAISFTIWRCVEWSAALTALMMLIIVVTIDLPQLPKGPHDRFFWILLVRETCFGAGAMVLAGSVWPRGRAGNALIRVGRGIVAAAFLFYAVEHFLFPRNVPGVPLEKMIPAWWPAPVLLSYLIGIVLLLAGVGLLIRSTIRIAAAGSGVVLLLLTVFFYLPIFLMETHTPLAVEGINYVGDTLLFAGTALLAGFGADVPTLWYSSIERV